MANFNGRKGKKVVEAPDAKFTLRDFRLDDWRWAIPQGTKLLMKRRVSAGMPQEMRLALEMQRDITGQSMSEVIRRCLRSLVMDTVVVSRKPKV